jgi:hypothetical protein
MTSELVFELVERKESPFFYAIDLTGAQKDVSIKQGSLAPEIKMLITRTKKTHSMGFEDYASLLIRFFSAVRSLDTKGWGDTNSTFYKARILRALLPWATVPKHLFAARVAKLLSTRTCCYWEDPLVEIALNRSGGKYVQK